MNLNRPAWTPVALLLVAVAAGCGSAIDVPPAGGTAAPG